MYIFERDLPINDIRIIRTKNKVRVDRKTLREVLDYLEQTWPGYQALVRPEQDEDKLRVMMLKDDKTDVFYAGLITHTTN